MTGRTANVEGVGARCFRNLAALVFISSTLLATEAYGQQVILAGSDLWSTPGGGQSTHSFATDPIPAGFFGPRSEAFDGTVVFEGLPLNQNPGLAPPDGIDLGMTDTIVRRLDDMSLQTTGDTASTGIEIIALSLVSVDPISIVIDGAERLFNLEAQLPLGVQQPTGQMTINHSIFDGGTFDATLPVNAELFFTDAVTGQFIGDALQTDLQLSANGVPWLFFPEIELVTIADSIQLINGTMVPATSSNFHTGVTINPDTFLTKCVLSLEESLLMRHGVLPARLTAGPDTDGDGISDDCDNCPETCNPLQEDADMDCVGDACVNGPGDPCSDVVVPPPSDCVPGGFDTWKTPFGGSHVNFCDDPIPAGFFGPGSDAFEGAICLSGREGLNFDTQLLRLDDMCFGQELPSEASTEIQIQQLDLVSCEPIVVTVGDQETLWDVAVGLSDIDAPPIGSLTATKNHENGGTFHAEFGVPAKFTFTLVDDPTGQLSDEVVLDTADAAFLRPPDMLSTVGSAPWVHRLASDDPLGFIPGADGSDDDPDTPEPELCCRVVCHPGATATHCNVVGFECDACPRGACCTPDDAAPDQIGGEDYCVVVEAETAGDPPLVVREPSQVCEEDFNGQYKGDGTNCDDSDGDGIPDVREINNCCLSPSDDVCNVRTNPTLADTDGDGISDGEEVVGGSDPCDECSVVQGFPDKDCNGNGTNDACETDTDGDGHIDDCDNCPNVANAGQQNADSDRHGDACDNCPDTPNDDQANRDGDALGDACDPPGPCMFGMLAFPMMLAGLFLMKVVSRRRRYGI